MIVIPMNTQKTERDIVLTIQNPQLIQLMQTLAKTMTSQQVNQHMETLLTIGHMCSETVKHKITCDPFIEPLKQIVSQQSESVNEIKDVFEQLVSYRNNSSKKGQLSEIISIRKLQLSYPGSQFEDTSKIPHSGDCHGTIGKYKILYEFKDYTNPVPKKEIEKFHRDLKASGYRIGVFCSNLSMITGKKVIDWELIDNHTVVVYISGMGMNGHGSVMGTQLLIALVETMVYDTQKGYVARQDICIDTSLERFTDLVDDYCNCVNHFDAILLRLSETKDTLAKAMLPLEKEIWKYKLQSETILRKMTQLEKYLDCEKPLSSDTGVFCTDIYIDKLHEIHKGSARILCEHALNHEIQLSHIDDILIGRKSDKMIFKTSQTKTRLDICFPIGKERYSCNPLYESVKSNHITITVKDNPDIWNCILERL